MNNVQVSDKQLNHGTKDKIHIIQFVQLKIIFLKNYDDLIGFQSSFPAVCTKKFHIVARLCGKVGVHLEIQLMELGSHCTLSEAVVRLSHVDGPAELLPLRLVVDLLDGHVVFLTPSHGYPRIQVVQL